MRLGEFIPPLLGITGLVIANYIYKLVKKYPEGDANVIKIGDAIHEGAIVFIRRKYRMLGIFLGMGTAFAFIVGAITPAG